MPIYEYRCDACHNEFEELVGISAPDPECPACGGEARKLVSASGFILKGGGWASDHYGLKSSSSASSASDGGNSSSTSSSDD